MEMLVALLWAVMFWISAALFICSVKAFILNFDEMIGPNITTVPILATLIVFGCSTLTIIGLWLNIAIF